MPKKIDLRGQIYGRLTVLREVDRNKFGHIIWECMCECGTKTRLSTCAIRTGKTKSCGCGGWRVGGRSYSSEYNIWAGMIGRCTNRKNKDYAQYGGRGITVCDRWRDFNNFLADVGVRPSPSHSLDRSNNEKGYSPDNCRWATSSVQARNQRRSVIIEYQDKRQCLKDWARELNINYATLQTRIENGWSPEKAFTSPVRQFGGYHEYKGVSLTLKEWAKESGVPYGTLVFRLRSGWDLERALTEPVGKNGRKRPISDQSAANE